MSAESKLGFNHKTRNDAEQQRDQYPRGEQPNTGSQAGGHNDFLQKQAGCLNHLYAVRTLYPSPFELVMKGSVLIDGEVHLRSVFQNSHADIACELISHHLIAKAD